MDKPCSTCKHTKPLSAFHKSTNKPDGHHSVCKECAKAYQKAYRKTERGREVKRDSTRNGGRFYTAKRHAYKKGREWTITRAEFYTLVAQACHYCDGKLSPTTTGLDRADSSLGYTIDNVVPCCRDCNTMKSNILSKEEMLACMALILNMRKGVVLHGKV